jgi:hypothetical protein
MSNPPFSQMSENPGLAGDRQFGSGFAIDSQTVDAGRPGQIDQFDFEQVSGKVVSCGQSVMRFGTWHGPFLLDNFFSPKYTARMLVHLKMNARVNASPHNTC